MGLINMMAIGATVPEAALDASLNPVLFGVVIALFAIGGLLLFAGRQTEPRTRSLRVVRPAFGVAR
jgi:hypothetical protein